MKNFHGLLQNREIRKFFSLSVFPYTVSIYYWSVLKFSAWMLHSHIRILPQWYATSFRFLNHCSCQALAYRAIIQWWSLLMSVQLPIKDSSYWGRLILPTLKLYPHWLSSSSNFQMVSSINIPFFLGFSPSLNCSHTDYLALAERNKPCLEYTKSQYHVHVKFSW